MSSRAKRMLEMVAKPTEAPLPNEGGLQTLLEKETHNIKADVFDTEVVNSTVTINSPKYYEGPKNALENKSQNIDVFDAEMQNSTLLLTNPSSSKGDENITFENGSGSVRIVAVRELLPEESETAAINIAEHCSNLFDENTNNNNNVILYENFTEDQVNNLYYFNPNSENNIGEDNIAIEDNVELVSKNLFETETDPTTILANTTTENNEEDSIEEYEPSDEEESSDEDSNKKPTKRMKIMPPKTNPGKKRYLNTKTWKRNIAKQKRNKGEEYISVATNKVVKQREIKFACDANKCKIKCGEKISKEQRKKIFDKFWRMADYSLQSAFVGKCVKRVQKKRITVKTDGNPSRRKSSLSYGLFNDGEFVTVCKTMFLNTLGITDMWVTTALKKIDETGILSPDKRGKHENRKRIPQSVRDSVKEHINLFPQVESHYCRQNTKKSYLEQGLSVAKMYRLYKEWTTENNITSCATEKQYRNIFDREFNLSFHQPKKDQCDTCYTYNIKDNKTDDEVNQHELHLKNKNTARHLKEEDKKRATENENINVACFDLQKVILIPCSEVSAFYYKSKLSLYNFTIFDLAHKEGFCYIWHQQIAKRGSNEIASCLFLYLQEMARRGHKEIVLYSDNCVGQNKNRAIIAMYLHASKLTGLNIQHRFLEQGHTQNENDSMHALIERSKKGKEIFTPDQFVMIVKMAKISGKPYHVKEMNQTEFFDFKKLVSEKENNWNKATDNLKINWNHIREITIKADKLDEVLLKYNLDDENHITLNLSKCTAKRKRTSQKTLSLDYAYKELIPIPKKTYEHLMQLCKSNKIPHMYMPFYKSLTHAEETDMDIDSD